MKCYRIKFLDRAIYFVHLCNPSRKFVEHLFQRQMEEIDEELLPKDAPVNNDRDVDTMRIACQDMVMRFRGVPNFDHPSDG